MMLDKGLDHETFVSLLDDYHDLIDLVKFGWGTAVLSKRVGDKVKICREHSIETMLGGTLYEYCMLTDQIQNFYKLLDSLDVRIVELSNGSGLVETSELLKSIKTMSKNRLVYHEVGLKDPIKNKKMTATDWILQISEGIAAGASMTILESRESGRSGLCDESGKLREDLCESIVRNFELSRIMFEAPMSNHQSYLIKSYGPDVNLGNIGYTDVLGVETLRLGLRYETLAANCGN